MTRILYDADSEAISPLDFRDEVTSNMVYLDERMEDLDVGGESELLSKAKNLIEFLLDLLNKTPAEAIPAEAVPVFQTVKANAEAWLAEYEGEDEDDDADDGEDVEPASEAAAPQA